MVSTVRCRRSRSVRPILDTQTRDFREVREVPAEQGRVVNQSDRRDFQILRSDSPMLSSQHVKPAGSKAIEIEQIDFSGHFCVSGEPSVGVNELRWRLRFRDVSQPAATLLFVGHNRRHWVFVLVLLQAMNQSQSRVRGWMPLQQRQVVSVQDEHSYLASSPSFSAELLAGTMLSTPRRAARLPRKPDHSQRCQRRIRETSPFSSWVSRATEPSRPQALPNALRWTSSLLQIASPYSCPFARQDSSCAFHAGLSPVFSVRLAL